jgi:DNA-binding transcriptional regulator YiaG
VSLADASRAKELFAALGRTIVSKASPLTGPEVRFLRKRLGKKAIEFAPMVSLTPEYLSALENNPDPVDPGRDKLVRLIYRELSGDKQLKKVFEKGQDFERWITSIHKSCVGENIFATHLRNNQWRLRLSRRNCIVGVDYVRGIPKTHQKNKFTKSSRAGWCASALYPLTFKEAVAGLAQVKMPEPESKKPKTTPAKGQIGHD